MIKLRLIKDKIAFKIIFVIILYMLLLLKNKGFLIILQLNVT